MRCSRTSPEGDEEAETQLFLPSRRTAVTVGKPTSPVTRAGSKETAGAHVDAEETYKYSELEEEMQIGKK